MEPVVKKSGILVIATPKSDPISAPGIFIIPVGNWDRFVITPAIAVATIPKNTHPAKIKPKTKLIPTNA